MGWKILESFKKAYERPSLEILLKILFCRVANRTVRCFQDQFRPEILLKIRLLCIYFPLSFPEIFRRFLPHQSSEHIWVKVLKNGPSKICERQPLKIFIWSILEYPDPYTFKVKKIGQPISGQGCIFIPPATHESKVEIRKFWIYTNLKHTCVNKG